MSETYGVLLLTVGAMLVLAALVWLLVRAFRTRRAWGFSCLFFPPAIVAYCARHFDRARQPLLLLAAGGAIIGGTFAANYWFAHHVPLGEREKTVNGELHLTLTGWDRADYSVLRQKPAAVVVQMANPDVSDETLEHLAGLSQLRELDLNDTRVTDAGLAVLAKLPRLAILRLRGAAVTDAGFREHLAAKESLLELDVRGTQVASKTMREWKAANKEQRKYLR